MINCITPFVSIIIPVFNTDELLLRQCVESILNQTYINIEIILVNDGSKISYIDPMLKDYAAKDERIVYIFKENGGVTSAREKGLEVSSGKYVFFLDSDDILLPNAIELCLKKAEEENADIVIGNYIEVYKNFFIERRNFINSNSTYDVEKAMLMAQCHRMIWGKLFLKDLFVSNTIEIPKDIHPKEDDIANFQLVRVSKNVVLVDEILCQYIQNQESVCNNMSKRGLSSLLFTIKWAEDFFQTHFEYEKIQNELAYYNLSNWTWFLSSGGKCEDKEILQLVYQKYLKNNFVQTKISKTDLLLIKKEKNFLLKIFYISYAKVLKPILKKLFPKKYVVK